MTLHSYDYDFVLNNLDDDFNVYQPIDEIEIVDETNNLEDNYISLDIKERMSSEAKEILSRRI